MVTNSPFPIPLVLGFTFGHSINFLLPSSTARILHSISVNYRCNSASHSSLVSCLCLLSWTVCPLESEKISPREYSNNLPLRREPMHATCTGGLIGGGNRKLIWSGLNIHWWVTPLQNDIPTPLQNDIPTPLRIIICSHSHLGHSNLGLRVTG